MKLRCFAVFLELVSTWVPLLDVYVNKGRRLDAGDNKGDLVDK